MALSWTEIEGGFEGEFEDSVSVEVEQGVERMLNKIKLLSRLRELEEDTPSWGMYWLLVSARSELEKGNFSDCLAWLYQAKYVAWYKLSVLEKITECIDLIYKIDQVFSHMYWVRLPVVEEKARILASVMPLIRPWVEEAGKRTRQESVRFYLGKYFFRTTQVGRLEYLLCAEFISAHFSTKTVRMLVQRALLEVLGGMYEYRG